MTLTPVQTERPKRLSLNCLRESTAARSNGIRPHGKTATTTFPHTFSEARESTSTQVIQAIFQRVSSAECSRRSIPISTLTTLSGQTPKQPWTAISSATNTSCSLQMLLRTIWYTITRLLLKQTVLTILGICTRKATGIGIPLRICSKTSLTRKMTSGVLTTGTMSLP